MILLVHEHDFTYGKEFHAWETTMECGVSSKRWVPVGHWKKNHHVYPVVTFYWKLIAWTCSCRLV